MAFELVPGASETAAGDPSEQLIQEYERLHAVAMLLNAQLIEAKREGVKSKVNRLTRLRASIIAERAEVGEAIRAFRDHAPDDADVSSPGQGTDLAQPSSATGSARDEVSSLEDLTSLDEFTALANSVANVFTANAMRTSNGSNELEAHRHLGIPTAAQAKRRTIGGWSLRKSETPFELDRERVDRRRWKTYAGRWPRNRNVSIVAAGLLLLAGTGAAVSALMSSGPRTPTTAATSSHRHRGTARSAQPPISPARSPQSSQPTQLPATTAPSVPAPTTATTAVPSQPRTSSETPSSGVQPTTNTTYPPDDVEMSASPQFLPGDGSTAILSVKVTTSHGVPVTGAPLTFVVSGGSCGSVSTPSMTVQDGIAEATYTAAGTTQDCTITVTETDSGQTSSFSWNSWSSASVTVVNQGAP